MKSSPRLIHHLNKLRYRLISTLSTLYPKQTIISVTKSKETYRCKHRLSSSYLLLKIHRAGLIIMKENADKLIQNNPMTSWFAITASSTLYTSRKSESLCKFDSNIDQTWFWGWNLRMHATRWRLLVDISTTRWRWSNYLYSQIFLPLGSPPNCLFRQLSPNFLFFDFICIRMI